MYTYMQLLCVGITRYPRAVRDMETSVYRSHYAGPIFDLTGEKFYFDFAVKFLDGQASKFSFV